MKRIILTILRVTTISLSLSSVCLAGTFDPSSLIPNGEGSGKSWNASSTKGAQVSLDITTENPKTTFKEGVNNTEGEHVLVGFAVWCNKTVIMFSGVGGPPDNPPFVGYVPEQPISQAIRELYDNVRNRVGLSESEKSNAVAAVDEFQDDKYWKFFGRQGGTAVIGGITWMSDTSCYVDSASIRIWTEEQ